MSFQHVYPPQWQHAAPHSSDADNFGFSSSNTKTQPGMSVTKHQMNQNVQPGNRIQSQDLVTIPGDFDACSWCTTPTNEDSEGPLTTAFSSFSESETDLETCPEECEYDLVLRNEVPPSDLTKNEYYAESTYGQGPVSLGDPHYYSYQVGQHAWGKLDGRWRRVTIIEVKDGNRTNQTHLFPPVPQPRSKVEMIVVAQYGGPKGFIQLVTLRPNTVGDIAPDDADCADLLQKLHGRDHY